MPARFLRLMLPRAVTALALASLPAAAQDATTAGDNASARELQGWLQTDPSAQAAPGESFKTVTATSPMPASSPSPSCSITEHHASSRCAAGAGHR